jgi:tetratricopeptide (TPR) repeat protein
LDAGLFSHRLSASLLAVLWKLGLVGSQADDAEADFAEGRRYHAAAAAQYLSGMWLRRSRFPYVIAAFDEVIAANPQDPRAYLGRGMAAERMGDLERAPDDSLWEPFLDPPMRFALAVADLDEHLRLNPHDGMAYRFRATLHKERKALRDAIADLNAAHKIAPDDIQACGDLAWILATSTDASLRDGPRAVEPARKACQAGEWKNPTCLDILAAALAETGAFEETIERHVQAIYVSGSDMTVRRSPLLPIKISSTTAGFASCDRSEPKTAAQSRRDFSRASIGRRSRAPRFGI